MTNVRKRRKHVLRTGRPPLVNSRLSADIPVGSTKIKDTLPKKSSKATRTLINTFHQLQKSRAAALLSENHSVVADLDAQLEELGGLKAYQYASLTGQDKDRGGDSSKKLVEWLQKRGLVGSSNVAHPLRILEVGSLSSQNAISRMIGRGVVDVKRIDLNSQEPDTIQEIDFMDFPIPGTDAEKFDLVSLSLVLNYVPSSAGRGEMLRRTREFLRQPPIMTGSSQEEVSDSNVFSALPCLFLVLPLPCVSNSRYMTRKHLVQILQHLGYEDIEHHESTKLCYMLLRKHACEKPREVLTSFTKVQINPGRSRNNFSITLESE